MTEQSMTRSKGDLVRTFICIDLPSEVKDRLERLQRDLKKIDAKVSWVRSSNVHLTLRFLGGVPESKLTSVREAATRAAAGVAPFEIEVAGSGCFPSARNPRVLWIGVAEIPPELSQLYDALEDELHRRGFPREPRKFSPHLTIGRLRAPGNGPALAEELLLYGFESARFQVREIIVMRSDLSPKGSTYTPQAVIALGVP